MTLASSCGCDAIFVAMGFIVAVVVDPERVVEGLPVVEEVVDDFVLGCACVPAAGFDATFALVCAGGFVVECGAFGGEVVGLP